MPHSPTVRAAVVLALAMAGCGGAEGPITFETHESVAESTTRPATSDPVVTTIVPDPTSTTVDRSTTTVPGPTTSAVESDLQDASVALAALSVAAEHADGYDRDLFRHWIDTDGDGCDARAEVLISESLGPVQRDYPCHVIAGDWWSAYDGAMWVDAAELDIDHVVALAEAWRSGAWQWSAGVREAYANDLTDERTLIAVTGSTNRSKGDDDPSDWLPPRGADTCRYLGDWLSIKLRWRLTVDPAEHTAMADLLRRECTGLRIAPVTAPPVAIVISPEIPPATTLSTTDPGSGEFYANCDAVRAAGMDPLHATDPGYRIGLDRDGDGIACE